ncbi:MAG: hypothetical protein IKO42_07105 [Opitutales bacterium]|nr:hypothetical protein [Opitutales bacterium]
MKKLAIPTLAALTLCGCSKCPYDYSSSEAFERSVYAQAEKEGLTKEHAEHIIKMCSDRVYEIMRNNPKTAGKMDMLMDGIRRVDPETREKRIKEYDLLFFSYEKKVVGSKTLKTLEAKLCK